MKAHRFTHAQREVPAGEPPFMAFLGPLRQHTDARRRDVAGGFVQAQEVGTRRSTTDAQASAASLRGLKVVLPVDGMSADSAYIEQFVAVHMTTAPLVSRNVTLTKLELIRF